MRAKLDYREGKRDFECFIVRETRKRDSHTQILGLIMRKRDGGKG